MPFSEQLLQHWTAVLRGNDAGRKRVALSDMTMFAAMLTDYEKFGLIGILKEQKTFRKEVSFFAEDYRKKKGAKNEDQLLMLKDENASLRQKLIESGARNSDLERKNAELLRDVENLRRNMTEKCTSEKCEAVLESLIHKNLELAKAREEIAQLMKKVADGKAEGVLLMEELARLLM